MFIAVINENFEVAEEHKKGKQTSHFYSQQKARNGTATWLRRLNPYRYIKANPVTVKVDNLPSNLVLPMQKVLIQDKSLRSDTVRTATAVSPHLILFFFFDDEVGSIDESFSKAWVHEAKTLSIEIFDGTSAIIFGRSQGQ
jgi:hypothetical protein